MLIGTVLGGVLQILNGLWQIVSGLTVSSLQVWVLLAWIGTFLFLVRWPDLRAQLAKGAWVAVILLWVLVAWVWGVNTRPTFVPHNLIAGLAPEMLSVLEKYLLCGFGLVIAAACGAAQDKFHLTPVAYEFAGPPDGLPEGHGHGHGHDDHGHSGHGHDDHGHGGHGHDNHGHGGHGHDAHGHH